ncbi:hypothetical protein [uncultured Fibrobacter sp.]|uniref:hypothetical protein n=1 Tax=uncultured Fibrobacter sp. TaxID=261512 RepID=UPI0028063ADE|nr:hypothetical protein [uncultured Fibrobacter sp.]
MEMAQGRFKVGDRIRIVRMDGEPEYSGREGVIMRISPAYPDCGILEQWYGTWGGLAVQPSRDIVEIVEAAE